MTQEAVLNLFKGLAVVFVLVGGFGCLACLPLAFASLPIATMSALFFVAGGVLMSGGLISFSILNGQK